MKATPMTQQDKTKILEWISGNTLTFRGVILGDYIDKDDLTTFIESLSTEDSETLQDGDWCEITSEEQASGLLDHIYPTNLTGFVRNGHAFYTTRYGDGILMYNPIDESQSLINKLTYKEFEQRAHNTFKTLKP